MMIVCDTCKKEYEEIDPESIEIYQYSGCAMICYECSNKMYNKQESHTMPTGGKYEV